MTSACCTPPASCSGRRNATGSSDSRAETFLKRLFAERPGCPESRRNEILALLEKGLEDISITRSRLSWAIPFPFRTSAGEEQGTWVWFDALLNYLTATGYPNPSYKSGGPAQLHVIGKDITRLHCVIWPAMLQAAELPLPEAVWAHGFISFGGARFSKSAGVTLSLGDTIDYFGTDAFRYFLLREVPFDGDGSFSWERFEDRYNADLANAWGNLASRTISMVERYRGGLVRRGPRTGRRRRRRGLCSLPFGHERNLRYLLHALRSVWLTVARGNEYVDRQAPWKLAKDPALAAELNTTLGTLIRQLARQCIALQPFMLALPRRCGSNWRTGRCFDTALRCVCVD